MKRRLGLLALALLVFASFALVKPVADQPPVDKEKTRHELETMKGILRTSLSYAIRNLNRAESAEDREFRLPGMEGSRVDAFYLSGQGAVFVIPVGNMGHGFHFDMPALALAAIPDPEEISLIAEEALRAAGVTTEGILAGTERDPEQVEKEREQVERQREQAERQRERLREQLQDQRQRLEERKAEASKRRAELSKRREELSKNLDQLAGHLRDTLATYGDSLSIVRPDESVTLILTTGSGFDPWRATDSPETRVLSVKKAQVTELKAGRVNRDEFNRRILEYSY